MANLLKRENGRQPAIFGNVVDQIFQNNLSRFFDDSIWGFNSGDVHGTKVPVNMRETDFGYEIELIVPGIQKEDLQLNISRGMLTIVFEEKKDNKETNKGEVWMLQEYRKRSFTKSFQLDDAVDINNINARYENGILYITLPTNEKTKQLSKSIKVE